ncbi:MAG: hypothetical protein QOD40_379 [Alphaproteobacteria bacterium]|jgi:hypothetical protein|nr:hypothetical protein [Alphaproteobacteria bacterium]
MSKKKKGQFSRSIIGRNLSIGAIAAENDDNYLFDCFIHLPIFAEITDLNNSKSILLGRTGCGKTAILRYIEEKMQNVFAIDPTEMALEYVASSTAIRLFEENGVDMNLFYQLLWKHVICVEIIRQRFHVNSEGESSSLFIKLFDYLRTDERKRKALEYLRDWGTKLWVNIDENIKEITQKFENELRVALGANAMFVEGQVAGGAKFSEEIKKEIKDRGTEVVSKLQMAKLTEIIDLLAAYGFDDPQQKYFLLIDGIDSKWADDSLRYKLIRALIETLKRFRKIRNLKIVVALRTDVLERALMETKDAGYQREKYDDMISEIGWEEKELRALVNERINLLYRRQYTKQNVRFEDLFPYKVGATDPFRFLIERTLRRPRDIIAFINQCLQEGVDQTEITARNIRDAELEYSRKRLNALEEEWGSVYKSFAALIDFIKQQSDTFVLSGVATRDIMEYTALTISEGDQDNRGDLFRTAKEVKESSSIGAITSLARKIIEALYRVGAVAIKMDSSERFRYCYIDQPIIAANSIPMDAKVRVHPMLLRALNVRESADRLSEAP